MLDSEFFEGDENMFGKKNWFVAKAFGWGLTPVTWQGWTWLATYFLVMLPPYALFFAQHRYWAAFIWLSFVAAVMLYDVWTILQFIKAPNLAKPRGSGGSRSNSPSDQSGGSSVENDGIHFLDSLGPSASEVATKNFQLRLRK